MKRISLFLSCLFIAVSMFASNLSGLLNKVGVEYDYDYVFVTNIADNTVKLEGTLNKEALAVEGLAVKVMVDGKVVGDATIAHDTVSYPFAGTYAAGDTIQANLLFKYKAGQTVTSGINYVVAYETTFNVTVPEGSEGCYLAFVGDSIEKAVEMKFISLNAYTATVPFNALGKEYFYSLKAEANFYEVDSVGGEAVTRTYAKVGQNDTVQAWNQICAPYYELIIDGKNVIEMDQENAVNDLELKEGATLQLREYTKLCTDSLTTFVPKAWDDDPIPYRLIDGNLALMQLGGYYDVIFDAETRELVMRRHVGNMLYIYRSYHESDIKAQPYAGFNATAEKVFVSELDDEYYLKITTADAKAAVAGLVGNAYDNSLLEQVVKNPSALVFDYKTNIAGAKSISIVKTSGDPASALPVFVYSLDNAKADDWKQVVIVLDENMDDKNALIQENEGDSYYFLFNIEGKDSLKGGELDIRDMYFTPYIKYSVTVPERTEECYLKIGNFDFFYEMEKDASLHYTKTFIDGMDFYGFTYNYYGGEGDEFIETDAKGEVAKPRFYKAEDVVVAWKDHFCEPKYSFLFEGQKTSFKNVEGAWLIESFEIAQRDSAHNDLVYYAIDDCTDDTVKSGTIPLVAGKYRIELNVADKKVTFSKLDDPIDPTVLCYDPAEITNAWDPSTASNDGTGVLTFTAAWAGIAKWLGEADWSAYEKLVVTYTSDIAFNFTIEDGNAEHNLQTAATASDTDKELVIDDFGSLDLSHITQFWFQGHAAGMVTVKSVCLHKPIQPTCYDPAEINNAWDPSTASNDGTGVLTFTAAWAGIAKWLGEADWSMYNRLVVTYTSDIAFNFTIEDGNAEHKLQTAAPASDTEKELVIDDFGSLDLSHITQFWFQGHAAGTVTVKSVCVSFFDGPVSPCKTIWEGEFALGDWAAGMQDLSWGGYDWSKVEKGQVLTAYFSIDESIANPVIRFATGDGWIGLPSSKAAPGADGEGNISIPAGTESMTITLTQEDLDLLTSKQGLVLCGSALIIKGVELCPPAENLPLCLDIVDEAFNALDDSASIAEGTMTFKAINSSMIMSLNGLDVSKYNTLTIEYEATTDFQVQLQDAQGEEQFVADADTNIAVYHYLADVDMKKLVQFIFVADTIGTVTLNSICFSYVEYPTYYLGNKWYGEDEVTYLEMSTDNHGDWTITGVLGSDTILLAFEQEPKAPVASYAIKDIPELTGKTLQIGDEVEFHCYEFLGNAFAAEIISRPSDLNAIKEDAQVVKFLHNGQLIIRYGEKNFNVLGQEL